MDRFIARVAAAQHGVIARRQLTNAGVGNGTIELRIARGLLVPLHRGVYAVGHRRLRREGFWLAAVLAAGPGAVLSHRDAAALHELRRPGDAAAIEVTSPARPRPTRKLRVYPRRALAPDDVAMVERIPVTSIARTLVDLAEVVRPAALLAALAEAERRRVLDMVALTAAAERVRTRRGRGPAVLRDALAEHVRSGVKLTRSDLEELFRDLIARAGVPEPQLNARIDGMEIDAVWRAQRLAVELDSWQHHGDRRAFQRDRRRGNRLELRGWRLLRYTYTDVVHDAARVGAELAAALAAPPTPPARRRAARRA